MIMPRAPTANRTVLIPKRRTELARRGMIRHAA